MHAHDIPISFLLICFKKSKLTNIFSILPLWLLGNTYINRVEQEIFSSSLSSSCFKPLFHVVSPSLTKDGYLVRYLPQYRAPVQAAMARLYNQPIAILASPISPPITSKDPSIPSLCESSRVTSSIEAVIQGIWSQFNTPDPFSRPPNSNLSAHPMTISPTPSPSHYTLFPWLAALLQKFQDTAWDRWRYSNGVL